MSKLPAHLKKGDWVAVVCPAGFVPGMLHEALELLESWGLQVLMGESVSARHNQFAGDDTLRAKDLQWALDHPEVRAVFAARGGYGTVRIIDQLNFSRFEWSPKWIVGFSDITVLHSHVQALFQISTIHGQMPMTIPEASSLSLKSLQGLLFGTGWQYHVQPQSLNRLGEAEGILVGGNLSLLVSLVGSISDIDYQDKVLFLEDVGEYHYALDRMLWMLYRAGKLAKLKGLIVGSFTHLKDNEQVSFGQSYREIIMDRVKEYDYPVCFGLSAGHQSDNLALQLGVPIRLQVSESGTDISYI
jgi:muramoyltetrapeptide carboxypeptidase